MRLYILLVSIYFKLEIKADKLIYLKLPRIER